jgi:hypothetical protein
MNARLPHFNLSLATAALAALLICSCASASTGQAVAYNAQGEYNFQGVADHAPSSNAADDQTVDTSLSVVTTAAGVAFSSSSASETLTAGPNCTQTASATVTCAYEVGPSHHRLDIYLGNVQRPGASDTDQRLTSGGTDVLNLSGVTDASQIYSIHINCLSGADTYLPPLNPAITVESSCPMGGVAAAYASSGPAFTMAWNKAAGETPATVSASSLPARRADRRTLATDRKNGYGWVEIPADVKRTVVVPQMVTVAPVGLLDSVITAVGDFLSSLF